MQNLGQHSFPAVGFDSRMAVAKPALWSPHKSFVFIRGTGLVFWASVLLILQHL